MEISDRLLTPNIYSRPQTPLKEVTKIAVHYVGNAGSSAIGNRNYFESLKNGGGVFASGHYIIGLNGEILRCVPENEIAYCTNSANSYSISIECCHPNKDGKFNQMTYDSLKMLCADICERYRLLPERDIIRHYDVSGKLCPLYWVNNEGEFIKFKREVKNLLENIKNNQNRINQLEKQVKLLESAVDTLKPKVYNNIDEVPAWAREAILKLIEMDCLKGDDNGDLGLSYSDLRYYTVNYRAGIYV